MDAYPVSPLVNHLSFDDELMWVELKGGRKLGVPLAHFPRLLAATPVQRCAYEISGGGSGLHWDDLDEDILVENLLLGIPDRARGHGAGIAA